MRLLAVRAGQKRNRVISFGKLSAARTTALQDGFRPVVFKIESISEVEHIHSQSADKED